MMTQGITQATEVQVAAVAATAAGTNASRIKADGVDRLADDLENDTLMTTPETARWLNVSKQFLEIGYGPPATVMSPKVVRYRKNAVLRAKAEALS
jgi:hypothetical protein